MQNVSDEGWPWGWRDYVRHYFFGEGRTVSVRETGHLKAVVAEFRRQAGDVPTRLPGQIADFARAEVDGRFTDTFKAPYEMQNVVFSLGATTISGRINGTRRRNHALLELRGTISFELTDEFRDPGDIEEWILEPIGAVGAVPTDFLGTPYPIVDRWRGMFVAKVLVDRQQSRFFYVPPR